MFCAEQTLYSEAFCSAGGLMMTPDRMHIHDLCKKSGLAELILLELENQRRVYSSWQKGDVLV